MPATVKQNHIGCKLILRVKGYSDFEFEGWDDSADRAYLKALMLMNDYCAWFKSFISEQDKKDKEPSK